MPVIITRSPCSREELSTSANTPATIGEHCRPENDIDEITWRVQSAAEMAGATKNLAASASRSCARAGLEGRFAISSLGRAPDEQIFELILWHRADQLERLRPPSRLCAMAL